MPSNFTVEAANWVAKVLSTLVILATLNKLVFDKFLKK